MATLYITECSRAGRDLAGYINGNGIPEYPPVAEQTVAIGAGSVSSSALNANTTMVRLMADSVCSIAVGANPTATATNMRLAANVPEYICVPKGSGFKIAAITNT